MAAQMAKRQASVLDPASAELASLEALGTAALRAELDKAIGVTVASLRRLAAIVRVLEERGEDLSDLRIGLLGQLRRIAHGQLLPEAVVRFGEAPGLLRTVAALPLPDQAKLARGEPVELVVRREGGGFDKRLADPLRLPRQALEQVFARGTIRDEASQILYLEGRPAQPQAPASRVKVGRVVADRRRKGLMIGRTFVHAASVVGALAELHAPEAAGEDEPEEQASGVPVRLSSSEHHALKQAALDGRTNVNALIRRALIAAGLI